MGTRKIAQPFRLSLSQKVRQRRRRCNRNLTNLAGVFVARHNFRRHGREKRRTRELSRLRGMSLHEPSLSKRENRIMWGCVQVKPRETRTLEKSCSLSRSVVEQSIAGNRGDETTMLAHRRSSRLWRHSRTTVAQTWIGILEVRLVVRYVSWSWSGIIVPTPYHKYSSILLLVLDTWDFCNERI